MSGPSEAVKGDQLNFECSTSDSNPPVDIWWVVDGRAVQVREMMMMMVMKMVMIMVMMMVMMMLREFCNTRLNIK